MTNDDMIMMFQQALTAELGIVIETSSVDAFKRKFYSVRRDCIAQGIEEVERLQLLTPPDGDPTQLWICKKEEADETNYEKLFNTV